MRMRHCSITILSTGKSHTHDYMIEEDSPNDVLTKKARRITSSDRDTVRTMTTCRWETCNTHLSSSGNEDSAFSVSDVSLVENAISSLVEPKSVDLAESDHVDQNVDIDMSGLSASPPQYPQKSCLSGPLPFDANESLYSIKSDTVDGINLRSCSLQRDNICSEEKRRSLPNDDAVSNDRFLDADESFPRIPKRLLRRTKTPAIRRANKISLGGFHPGGIKIIHHNEMKKTENVSSTNSFLGDADVSDAKQQGDCYKINSGGRFSGGQCPPINYDKKRRIHSKDVEEKEQSNLSKTLAPNAIFDDGDDHNLDLDLPDYTFKIPESTPAENKGGKTRFRSLHWFNKVRNHKFLILHICRRFRSPLDSWKRKK